MQSNIVADWLEKRGITQEIQSSFGVSEAPQGHVIIPVNDIDGNFSFNKYRRSPSVSDGPKYWYDGGGKVTLYGAHLAKDGASVLVTEGEMDCLVSWSCNIPSVTSTGGAMSFQKEWVPFFDGKAVIICFDNDKAGAEGMVKALEMVPWAKILILPDSPTIKDISDYVTMGGDLNELIKTARHFQTIEEVIEDRSARIALMKSTHFHDAYLALEQKRIDQRREEENRAKRPALEGTDVERARAYPIPELLKFSQGKACCPFHHEKTPSLQYYQKTNTCYCFGGCGKSYDAIDVYMKLNGCRFREAVTNMK